MHIIIHIVQQQLIAQSISPYFIERFFIKQQYIFFFFFLSISKKECTIKQVILWNNPFGNPFGSRIISKNHPKIYLAFQLGWP
jgi:hypothetical protein